MDVKLDFSNVLIRPKRSTLQSRAQVSLTRSLTFKHSKRTFTGIPCIASQRQSSRRLRPSPPSPAVLTVLLLPCCAVGCLPLSGNMDTTGTFAMADELYKHGLMTAIHKHYTAAEWAAWRERRGGQDDVLNFVCASSGILDEDWTALDAVLEENAVPMVCLDVANGYSEHFVNFVRRTREKFPKHTIMVRGSTATPLLLLQAVVSHSPPCAVLCRPATW
jgi:GMP reductase